MSEKIVMPITGEQIAMLLGIVGSSEQETARKYAATPEGAERKFYGSVLGKLNDISNLLRDHDPRRLDTAQDVDDDEWVAGEDHPRDG